MFTWARTKRSLGWMNCARGEVLDYKDRLPRHASLPRLAQAFAAAQPKKLLGSPYMSLGLKKP